MTTRFAKATMPGWTRWARTWEPQQFTSTAPRSSDQSSPGFHEVKTPVESGMPASLSPAIPTSLNSSVNAETRCISTEPVGRTESHGLWAFEGFSVSVAGSDCGDGSSITAGVELGHGGFGEVAAVGDLPFVVHVGQHSADEADDGGLVGEDPDHPGAAFEALMSSRRAAGRRGAWCGR